jgi:RimJ/RimL family protein N-acetyltransferase
MPSAGAIVIGRGSLMNELEGQRIRLRPVEHGDLSFIRLWRSDPDVTRFWITREVPTMEELKRWLTSQTHEGAQAFTIQDEMKHPIGYVDLFNRDAQHKRAELSLMIGDRERWGKGYAREALQCLLRFAFSPEARAGLALHKVTLCVVAENHAARRLYTSCGFREDGVLRDDMWIDQRWHDQILMSILEGEFADDLSAPGE